MFMLNSNTWCFVYFLDGEEIWLDAASVIYGRVKILIQDNHSAKVILFINPLEKMF